MKIYDEEGRFTPQHRAAMGDRMGKSIKLAGMTQAGVADLIGCSRGAVNQYVHGVNSIGLEMLARFCKATKASMDYIVFGVDAEMEQMVSAVLQEVIAKRSPKAKP